MADAADDPRLFLVEPDFRGLLPLNSAFHVPRRLARTIRNDGFQIRKNTAFTRVMELCAAPAADRKSTWINSPIINLYSTLHRMGYAHSVECWDGERLVGGLYGVSLGGAFFGESMFSRESNASKVALVHLVARLIRGGFKLLDTQFTTEHLSQFGIEEVPRKDFKRRLDAALKCDSDFHRLPEPVYGADALQLINQTS
jgi:leucyl/phenylalanyl-tRNA---protein transferase